MLFRFAFASLCVCWGISCQTKIHTHVPAVLHFSRERRRRMAQHRKMKENPSFIESNEVNEYLKTVRVLLCVRCARCLYTIHVARFQTWLATPEHGFDSSSVAFTIYIYLAVSQNAHKMQNRRKRMILLFERQRQKANEKRHTDRATWTFAWAKKPLTLCRRYIYVREWWWELARWKWPGPSDDDERKISEIILDFFLCCKQFRNAVESGHRHRHSPKNI